MAELPDLSVFAATLNKRFKGKTLKNLEIHYSKKLNVSEAELKSNLEHHKLQNVVRSGKTLQFHFGKEKVLGLHLMLRGELKAITENEPIPKHTILAFYFSEKQGLLVTDPLKQAKATLNPPENKVPDALDITVEQLQSLTNKRNKPSKNC